MIALGRGVLRGSRFSMELVVEQKRRSVFRVAGLRVLGAWLFAQLATTLTTLFEAPVSVWRASFAEPLRRHLLAKTGCSMPAVAPCRAVTPAGSA